MTAYRIRVLYEDYSPDDNEEDANSYVDMVKKLLTAALPEGRVFTYVEANPPKDEVEEWQ